MPASFFIVNREDGQAASIGVSAMAGKGRLGN
jgi:hypothetical protein